MSDEENTNSGEENNTYKESVKIKHRKRRAREEGRKMYIETDDGHRFYAEVDTLLVSGLLRLSITQAVDKMTKVPLDDPKPVHIPNIDNDTLKRVLWWMDNHLEDKDLNDEDVGDEPMDAWQRDFFNTTIDNIMKMVSAANYLMVPRLITLGTNKLAQIIDEKMSEENPIRALRDTFHVQTETLTPEDKEKQERLDENLSQLFVFDGRLRSKDRSSNIDVLNVEVTHLPPRRLEYPNN